MTRILYNFYECQNQECALRFPAIEGCLLEDSCPRCRSPVIQRVNLSLERESAGRSIFRCDLKLEAFLDNIRSVWNVGSMFRTADGTGLNRVYLAGITPTPKHSQIRKTALGAEDSVPWEYSSNGVKKIAELKMLGCRIWALEDIPQAEMLFTLRGNLPIETVVLVVGNEVCGIDPGILEQCDRILSIPMLGAKRSYNVAVAFGIAASYLRYCQIFSQGSTNQLPNNWLTP